jgi:glycosyltransferase involved in cell wall biosynthesis
VHEVQDEAPDAGCADPGEQLVQEGLPDPLENVPGVQREQLAAPPPENVPLGHDTQPVLPGDGWTLPAAHGVHAVLPELLVNEPGGHGVHGMLPVALKDPGEHGVPVPHCGPEKPTLHEHTPLVGLLFTHVPFPLHTTSHAKPLEHGLHAHVPAEKFVHTPLPLQLTSHPPAPVTGLGKGSVRSVLPIASAVMRLSRARPAVVCMYGVPPAFGEPGSVLAAACPMCPAEIAHRVDPSRARSGKVAPVRVLFMQPSIGPPGGGNLVAAWMIEALREEHRVTLLARDPPDLAACNRIFGTSLRPEDFEVLPAPGSVRRLGALAPTPLALVKHALLLRRARQLAPDYDVLMTADNEADFGRRGIQYVHYPKLDPVRPDVDLRWYHGSRSAMALYYRLARRLGGMSDDGIRRNLTLVNSAFIAARIRKLYGVDPVVLHPPVPGDFPVVPWEARENGVVALGRISPEKRLEDVVEILRRVRARGEAVRLHLVGTGHDAAYTARIRRLVAAEAAWIRLHEDLARAELVALLARQRYGLHAMVGEHFGIAVAEMVRAGCIVFVPRTGGPIEIVGDDRLLFSSVDDAADRIVATLRDPARQADLRAHLAARAERFSTAHFVARMREIVRAC